MSSFDPIISLQRGLSVLAVVNKGKSVSPKTIYEETGLHKATIIRMLETLVHEGYVAKTARSTYVSTGRTLLLSQGFNLVSRVGDIAGPVLADFRRSIVWPSDIALYNDDSMLIVQTSRDRGPLYFKRESGYRAPMLSTSLGQAYLAFCDTEHRARILERLATVPDPRNDLGRDRATLERNLADVRAKGFATMHRTYSMQEYGGKVWGMAVPVRDGQNVYAAINILMLRTACGEQQAIKRFLGPLQQVAARLADAIGSETPGTPLDESIVGNRSATPAEAPAGAQSAIVPLSSRASSSGSPRPSSCFSTLRVS
jgi:IclR family transcriptional regulator, mhp operon transcriptional activator